MVARMGDRVVQVMRVADRVAFSNERGWVMVCFDWEHGPVVAKREKGGAWRCAPYNLWQHVSRLPRLGGARQRLAFEKTDTGLVGALVDRAFREQGFIASGEQQQRLSAAWEKQMARQRERDDRSGNTSPRSGRGHAPPAGGRGRGAGGRTHGQGSSRGFGGPAPSMAPSGSGGTSYANVVSGAGGKQRGRPEDLNTPCGNGKKSMPRTGGVDDGLGERMEVAQE